MTKNKGWTKEGMRHQLAARGVRTTFKQPKHDLPLSNFEKLLEKSTYNALMSVEGVSDSEYAFDDVKRAKEIVNQEITRINKIMEVNGFVLVDIDKENNQNFAGHALSGVHSNGIFDLYYIPKNPELVNMEPDEWLRIDGSYYNFKIDILFEILPKGAHSYSAGNYKMRLLKNNSDHLTTCSGDLKLDQSLNLLINGMKTGKLVNAEDCW